MLISRRRITPGSRATAQQLERARTEARTAHKIHSTPENSAAWKASVTAAEEANQIVREVRDRRTHLSALSELLASLLRERRTAAGTNLSENATNTGPIATATATRRARIFRSPTS
jgi:hypothetical protein